jgi:hypothetical protein
MLPDKASKQPLEKKDYRATEIVRQPPIFEVIDSAELAARWSLPESWIRERTRCRAVDPIPHLKFGRYIRFRWGSSELTQWLERRAAGRKPS